MKRFLITSYLSVSTCMIIWLLLGLCFNPAADYGKDLLGMTFLGLVIGLGSYFYERSSRTFLVGLVHSIFSLIAFIIVGLWLAWFPFDLGVIVGAACLFIGIFFVIWTGIYLIIRQQVHHINQQLKK